MLALALAAAVCGGPGDTLAAGARARVFERGGAIRACHRERRGSWRLGAAPVDEARVLRRFVLLRRGNRLRVYDVRNRRGMGEARPSGTLVRFVFRRNGVAAYLARVGDEHQIGVTRKEQWLARGHGIDPAYLRYAGTIVAYRMLDGRFGLAGTDVRSAPAGEVARSGDLRVVARGWTLHADGTYLGDAQLGCASLSPGDCGGIDGLRLAPPFVAVRENHVYRGAGGRGAVTVFDLRARSQRSTCSGGFVGDVVVSPAGDGACIRGTPRQVVLEDRVLDEGDGIAPGSLRVRGDELVWTHDGEERAARLASQP